MNQERQLGLGCVNYSIYEGAIKRYGYTGRVRDDSLKEIADYINLTPKQLDEADSYTAKTYRAKKAFHQGNYDVEYLLVLGFLLCNHESEEKAADSLWGIINPDIASAVPTTRVLEIVDKMIYYAIDAPYEIAHADDKTDASIKSYLEELKHRAPQLRSDVASRFSDAQVHKNEMLMVLTPKWYGSYKIRALVCPEKARA